MRVIKKNIEVEEGGLVAGRDLVRDGQMPQTAPGKSSEIYFYDIHYAYIDKTDFSIHYIGHYSYVGAGAGRITTPAGAIVENGITVCEGFMLRLAFMPILTYFLVPWKFMVNYCVSYSIFYWF